MGAYLDKLRNAAWDGEFSKRPVGILDSYFLSRSSGMQSTQKAPKQGGHLKSKVNQSEGDSANF